MSVLLSAAEFASDSYMGSTGTKPANAVQVAIDIAEGAVSDALGFPAVDGVPTFLSQQWMEEHTWPYPNRPLKLRRPRLASLDEVLALHDAGTCDCTWLELTACGFVYDARQSLVLFRTCEAASRCWSTCVCPHRVRVTYTAGFTAIETAADTETGRRLRLATALVAREVMELLDFYTEGVAPIQSFGSMGYSESRDLARTTLGKKLGKGWLPEHAANLLEPLAIRHRGVVVIRGH